MLMRRFFRCYQPKSFQGPRRGGLSGLATPIFSFSLSSLEPKSLRMVILTIILVQVLCCHSITKITRNGINGAMFVTDGRFQFEVLDSVLGDEEDDEIKVRVSIDPCLS